MNRSDLRAGLLLAGFTVAHKYDYVRLVTPIKPLPFWDRVYVFVRPYWTISVVSPHGSRIFISPKKAWRYINKVLESYDE